MKKIIFSVLFVAFSLSGLVYYTQSVNSADQDETSTTIIDDLERSVHVPNTIDRIVSLAPNITEILFSLGPCADCLIKEMQPRHEECLKGLGAQRCWLLP